MPKKIFLKLPRRKKPLESGSYEATIKDVKETKTGNIRITLGNIKKKEEGQ